MRFQIADSFDLRAKDLHIRFAIREKIPTLSYRSHTFERTFTGAEVCLEPTSLGQLVTVTLEAIPDLRVCTFTLLLPTVHVAGAPEHVEVEGIHTTHRTSIGGPALVQGALATYKVQALKGTAICAPT